MRAKHWQRKLLLIGSLVSLVLGGLGIVAWSLPHSREEQRLAAQRRWEARPFSAYRVTVEIERLNTTCIEDLEVRGAEIRVIQDSCAIGWLPDMIVPNLFQLGARLERGPECFPPAGCSCARVRSGRVTYDKQLGFPREISIRRYYRPSWHQLDYWRYSWRNWELPSCSTSIGGLNARVLALTPLD
jgi:hypothetical protein